MGRLIIKQTENGYDNESKVISRLESLLEACEEVYSDLGPVCDVRV